MAGLCRLAGAQATTGGEGRWLRREGLLQPVSSHAAGYDDSARAHLSAYMRDDGVNADPIFQRLSTIRGGIVTRRRAELVPDREWYRSRIFTDHLRPCGSDHRLTSLYAWGPTGETSCFTLLRALGERIFPSVSARSSHSFMSNWAFDRRSLASWY